MTKTPQSPAIVLLVANGFDENHMTEIQRTLVKSKIGFTVVAPEQGLVNGWQDNAWGHYFPVDSQIGSIMGSDFDALILIGGERGVEKLKANLHTRRLVNHFLDAEKPIAAIGAGVSLLLLSPKSSNKTVSAQPEMAQSIQDAGLIFSDEPQFVDGNLLTSNGTDVSSWAEQALSIIETIELESPESEQVEAA